MSKRRRKKPNLSQETLDRAREEAGLPPEVDEDDEDEELEEAVVSKVVTSTAVASTPTTAKAVSSTSTSGRRRKRTVGAAQLDKRKADGKLNANYIADMLEHPTKTVTEEQLHAEYGFVLKDLRNMGLLAAALFASLIIFALVAL